MPNEEYPGIEELDLGPQNDGEPVAVEAEPVPEPEPAAEAAPEEVQEPDKPEGEPEKHAKKPGSVRARERAARLESENEALRQMLLDKQLKAEAPVVQPIIGKPKAEDFESYEAFNEALTDWKVNKILEDKAQQESIEKHKKALDAVLVKGRGKYEDFDADFEEIKRAPLVSATVAEALLDSEQAPDLVHHFADNPDELRRISLLSPLKASKEITALEAKFTAPTPKPTSKAPAPLRPVAAAPVTVTDTRFGGIEEY